MKVTMTPIEDLAERARAVVTGVPVDELPYGLAICIDDVASLLTGVRRVTVDQSQNSDELQ